MHGCIDSINHSRHCSSKKKKNQPQPAGYVHEVRWFYRRIRSWCLSSSDLSHVSGCQAPADAEVSWSQAMVFQVIPIRFGALVSGPFKGSDGSWVVVFWGFFNSCKCYVTFRWHEQSIQGNDMCDTEKATPLCFWHTLFLHNMQLLTCNGIVLAWWFYMICRSTRCSCKWHAELQEGGFWQEKRTRPLFCLSGVHATPMPQLAIF